MSNSSLIDYTDLSPHYSNRTHKIDTISIHCMAGNLTVESCGRVFHNREASSNYGIGSDGRRALYVPENKRSWCTSSWTNDDRAITIEVANDGGEPDWHVSDAALDSLIELLIDICKRNDIQELKWQADKNLIGQIDKQNMTVHRWFKQKACPGDYLYNKHYYIAEQVNKELNKQEEPIQEKGDFSTMTQLQKELFVKNVLYIGLLDRDADESGLKYWVNKLNDTVSLNDILNDFMELEEYRKRTVLVAYDRLLGRKPEDSALTYWTNWLKGEKSADDLYKTLKNTDEYKKKH